LKDTLGVSSVDASEWCEGKMMLVLGALEKLNCSL